MKLFHDKLVPYFIQYLVIRVFYFLTKENGLNILLKILKIFYFPYIEKKIYNLDTLWKIYNVKRRN